MYCARALGHVNIKYLGLYGLDTWTMVTFIKQWPRYQSWTSYNNYMHVIHNLNHLIGILNLFPSESFYYTTYILSNCTAGNPISLKYMCCIVSIQTLTVNSNLSLLTPCHWKCYLTRLDLSLKAILIEMEFSLRTNIFFWWHGVLQQQSYRTC